jgi:hypothetical protein
MDRLSRPRRGIITLRNGEQIARAAEPQRAAQPEATATRVAAEATQSWVHPYTGVVTHIAPPRRREGNPDWRARRGQRTISEKHADFELSVDRAKARGLTCEIDGCNRAREDFGRYCAHHRLRQRGQGHPEGRPLKRRWLADYAATAAAYIDQIRSMPPETSPRQQLTLAEHWLRSWFAQSSGSINFRPGQSLTVRTRRWVANAVRHDLTTEKALALVVAVYCYREAWEGFFEDQAHFQHQLAKILLEPRPRRPEWMGARRYEIMGFRLGQHIGSALHQGIGTFCAFTASALIGNAMAGWPKPEPVKITKTAMKAAVHRPTNRPIDRLGRRRRRRLTPEHPEPSPTWARYRHR